MNPHVSDHLHKRFADHIRRNSKCGCAALCSEIRTAWAYDREALKAAEARADRLAQIVADLTAEHETMP